MQVFAYFDMRGIDVAILVVLMGCQLHSVVIVWHDILEAVPGLVVRVVGHSTFALHTLLQNMFKLCKDLTLLQLTL